MPENWLTTIWRAQQGNSPAASDATKVARKKPPQLPDNIARPTPDADPLRFVPQPARGVAKGARWLAKSSMEGGASVAHNLNKGVGYLRAGDARSSMLPLGLAIGETVLNVTGGGAEGQAAKLARKPAREAVVAVASRHGATKRIFVHAAHPMAELEGANAGLRGYFENGYLVGDGVNLPRFVARGEGDRIGRRAQQVSKKAPVGALRSEYIKKGVLPQMSGEFKLPTGPDTPNIFDAKRDIPQARNTLPAPHGGRPPSPSVSPHAPNSFLSDIAKRYVETSGISPATFGRPEAVDALRGKQMADAYAALKSDPQHPDVVKAYQTFGKEVEAQAKALEDAGYTRTMMDDDPYENSAAMLRDLRDNKHLRVFKTNADNPHPLLTNDQNDQFRWVHDVLGHGQQGNQFGPLGEERAFRDHAAMFSPEARRVMATETRGQNSWVNFGPNSHLPMKERPFAEQKAALFPEHLMGEYGTMDAAAPPQFRIPRVVPTPKSKIPVERLDEIEDRAHRAFLSPSFMERLNIGNKLKGGPDWYDASSVEEKAKDALGDDEGKKAFSRLMEMMGATTARSRPQNNLRRATWWRGLELAGLIDPAESRLLTKIAPKGMGHIAQQAHADGISKLMENGSINSLLNPKPAAFVENLRGNWMPYTNDTRMATLTAEADPKIAELGGIHMQAASKYDKSQVGSPRHWAYGPMERAAQRASEELAGRGLVNVKPGHHPTAAWQSSVWTGASPENHTGSFADDFNILLDRSAKLWGKTPGEANRLMWQGNPFDLPLNSSMLRGKR